MIRAAESSKGRVKGLVLAPGINRPYAMHAVPQVNRLITKLPRKMAARNGAA